eukprot:TRINITY_DN5318_c0_g1_i3.p1 TRINITY_DN5318_c0_g1~~TRINITY_DN5318_c0_g1_i3.p1  ORF type:complete len:180 (-),score=39.55 TRINITY_DN5318_c0_g1_i3:216-725(-)
MEFNDMTKRYNQLNNKVNALIKIIIENPSGSQNSLIDAFENEFGMEKTREYLNLPNLERKIEKRGLMLGLDGGGKTSILYKLKLGENINAIPTIGFNVETITKDNIHLTLWDVGGQQKIRQLWRHYLQNTDYLFFVIDSSAPQRLNEAREELSKFLKEQELEKHPFCIN